MRLFVNRPVRWNDGSRDRTGKVKQILGDHVVIKADSGEEYIVARSSVGKPTTTRKAMTIIAPERK